MPAHILREAERARVRFSYDADVVEALKVRIPSRYRKWDPADKLWIVSEPWVSTVANLMVEHFGGHVTVDDRRPGHEPPPRAKAVTAEREPSRPSGRSVGSGGSSPTRNDYSAKPIVGALRPADRAARRIGPASSTVGCRPGCATRSTSDCSRRCTRTRTAEQPKPSSSRSN